MMVDLTINHIVGCSDPCSFNAKFESFADWLSKKMGVKALSPSLTFLPLLALALKRAPRAGGGQSPKKEVYS